MANQNTQGGASASPVSALPAPKFPRRAQRFDSMGESALRIMRLRGEIIPANVATLAPQAPVEPVRRSPELALFIALFGAMTDEQKAAVRQNLYVGTVAYPNDLAMRQAHDLLSGGRE